MGFKDLLKMMIEKDGSDLFLTTGAPPSMKAHGKLTPLLDKKFGIDPHDDTVVWTDDQLQRLIESYVVAAGLDVSQARASQKTHGGAIG